MAKFRLYFTALLIAFVFAILPKYSLALSVSEIQTYIDQYPDNKWTAFEGVYNSQP
jgi:hypothetical protein